VLPSLNQTVGEWLGMARPITTTDLDNKNMRLLLKVLTTSLENLTDLVLRDRKTLTTKQIGDIGEYSYSLSTRCHEITRDLVKVRSDNATKKMKRLIGTLGGSDTYTRKLATLFVVGLCSRLPSLSTNKTANQTIVNLFTGKYSKRLAVDVRRHLSNMDDDDSDEDEKKQINIDVVFSGIAQAHPSSSCALTKCMCRATAFSAPSSHDNKEYDRVCLDIDVLIGLRDLRLQINDIVVPPSLVTKIKVAVKTNKAYHIFAHGLFDDDGGGDDYGRALVAVGALSIPSAADTVLFRSSMAWKSLSSIVRADVSTLTTDKAVGTYLYNVFH
jgi:hypothetical protein